MKKLVLVFCVLALSAISSANNSSIVTASGTSEWLRASAWRHEASAVANFRIDAFEKCAQRGYSNWVVLSGKCSPSLFGVPCYTYTATVRCH
ncbi:MAG: hypothetical protein H6624_12630 [Bdellovibrionaceae bacterium]|nr:hypothetical protein [Bdellovibrionales bacterium]MCB9085190.1 hypothetical protein [Pseudobdellovibrionaceae bacterium]